MNSVSALAVRPTRPDDFGMLNDVPLTRWKLIEAFIASEWQKNNDKSRVLATALVACLDKLSMVLLQAKRIQAEHDLIIEAANQYREFAQGQFMSGKGKCEMAFRGATACGDFEGLLLQARAALDCLCLLVDREAGLNFKKGDSFRHLPVHLRHNVRKSNRLATAVLSVFEVSGNWTAGLMTKVRDKGLRDFVAHRGNLATRTSACFSFIYLDDKRFLVTDCETRLFPIFRTTVEAVTHISQLILNTISCFANIEPLALGEFRCTWQNQSVVISDYVIKEPEGSPLGLNYLTVYKRMTPDGYDLQTHNVNPSIYTKAIEAKAADN